ncbi:3-hydroxyacyl-CoA dehydrogenase [Pseudomaricurvus alcaniphilus]|uniref:3-hydroxyacyl-CoA dehydrogenase n=1 Tax=Pseudomaricurvus alcaniphilus TaxID=1166482 RepID=UPI00140BAF06|nr:3-hydroxyacyl-CoA dehydrogenase [Pseudomaricurvus alcaniphilus]NHN39007.1 3-hydroxyacyl-CoA dehydrogenase [Pseudomaricurvus alcaniphilus]
MKQINKIGVVGAGAMGRGIVQLFVQAGHPVVCFDMAPAAVASAVAHVSSMIQRSIDKGRLPAAVGQSLADNLIAGHDLQALADCDLVVEAIVEDVAIKQSLFCELEGIVAADTILASNTSSLVVADIAAKCQRAERLAGLHFFNPVPLMKVAEIIAAVRTEAAVVASLKAVVEGAGHRAVVAADQPGFLVNHAGRGLYTEGLRVVEEQVATPQQIDTLMREAAGFKMGPFELMDLTGLDVSGKVMESIYQQFQQEPRFRPSALVPPRMAAGLYGRKSGAGWYPYADGKRVDSAAPALPQLPGAGSVWVDERAEQAAGLKNLVSAAGLNLCSSAREADLLLIQPWGEDASHYCARLSLDAEKTVAVDPLPGLDKHRTLMLTCVTAAAARDLAHALLTHDGVAATVIGDSPGFVLQRVLATIVNIAANIVQRGIASVDDLEDAVRLGLGYPEGPLSIGERVGGAKILQVLQQQQAITGDDRYRPSLWLSRRVKLGQSLLQLEAERV